MEPLFNVIFKFGEIYISVKFNWISNYNGDLFINPIYVSLEFS